MDTKSGGTKQNLVTRRNFVAASIAAATLLAATGCTSNDKLTETEPDDDAVYRLDPELDSATDGKWVQAACWHNCGGRCVNYAYVADGVVLRQKTDDSHEDSFDYPQQRACMRGRSQRQQNLGADRLKYPMKRKNWQPGGGENSQGQLRGVDEWERISWDEAIGYVVDEIKRIVEQHGNRAIFGAADGHYPGPSATKALSLYGGYVPRWGTGSWGTWSLASACIGVSASDTNDRFDYFNCDYVVMVGQNTAWSSAGNPTYWAKNFEV